MKLGSIEYRKELMLVLLRITRVTGIRYLSRAQVFCNKYTDSNLEACFRGAVMRIIQENHEITLFRVVWYLNYSITVLQFGKEISHADKLAVNQNCDLEPGIAHGQLPCCMTTNRKWTNASAK